MFLILLHGAGGGRLCPLPISHLPSRTFSIRSYLHPWLQGVRKGHFLPLYLLFHQDVGFAAAGSEPGSSFTPGAPGGAGCLQQHHGPGRAMALAPCEGLAAPCAPPLLPGAETC